MTMTKTKWVVDQTHSSVDFSIKHLMISKVKGSFNEFNATIEADVNDLSSGSIQFTVDANSIDTRNTDRDNHLRSADFFDVENHPTMTFVSKQIEKKAENEYIVTGDLTIRGITNTEKFEVTYEGNGVDPWGNEKVGFSSLGSINRSEYGLTWNAALEAGGVLVGDQIKFDIQVQAVKA